jgi:vancomycin resistance protein YoaR
LGAAPVRERLRLREDVEKVEMKEEEGKKGRDEGKEGTEGRGKGKEGTDKGKERTEGEMRGGEERTERGNEKETEEGEKGEEGTEEREEEAKDGKEEEGEMKEELAKEREGEKEEKEKGQETKKSKKRYIALFGDIAVLVVALAYTLLCAMVNTEHILPNTEVNGVQLGSMSVGEATKALEADWIARCEKAEFHVAFGEDIYDVPVGDALELDCKALAEEALKLGQGSFFARGGLWLSAFLGGTKKQSLPKVTDLEALHKAIKGSGLLELDTTTQTSYKKKKKQLVFTMGKTGEVADEKKLIEQMIAAAQIGDFETVLPCPTEAGEVEAVDLEGIYKKIHTKPADAALDPENNYEIVKSVKGVGFDKKKARKLLEKAEEGATVAIDLVYKNPKITTKAMRKRLFKDQLASFTTKVAGSPNRRANISLAVQKCNGAILQKGDVFSFNDAVGEQTAEAGFMPATATKGTEVVQAYGGGICQVSTTIFEAALYAGLEIPERWCHVYLSSYADPGMDAAVAWGALDLKLKNQEDYPVKLEVKEEGEDLTVTVWGTKLEERPIEIEVVEKGEPDGTEAGSPGGKDKPDALGGLEISGDTLDVVTYRNIYNADKSQVFREKIGDSSYLDPSKKVD